MQFTWGGPPVQTLLLGKKGEREEKKDFSEILTKTARTRRYVNCISINTLMDMPGCCGWRPRVCLKHGCC